MRQCYPIAVPDCVSQVTINAPSGVIAALYSRPGGEARASAVFLPGFSGSKEDFIPMLAALSAGGYRVVAYDQAGQYESGGPSQPAGYSMQLFTDDLLAVIKKVGEGRRVHVLGHSFGGLVARRAVIVAPSLVRSLTLLDSGPDGASLKRRRLLGPLAWLVSRTWHMSLRTRPSHCLWYAAMQTTAGRPKHRPIWPADSLRRLSS